MQRESDIENEVCTYAKKNGFLVFKFTSPGSRGVPDRLFINSEGTPIFIEFKKPRGRVAKLQQVWISRLRKQGVVAEIFDNAKDAIRFLTFYHD